VLTFVGFPILSPIILCTIFGFSFLLLIFSIFLGFGLDYYVAVVVAKSAKHSHENKRKPLIKKSNELTSVLDKLENWDLP